MLFRSLGSDRDPRGQSPLNRAARSTPRKWAIIPTRNTDRISSSQGTGGIDVTTVARVAAYRTSNASRDRTVYGADRRRPINVRVAQADRKSVVQGKSVDLGGRRILKKKNTTQQPDLFP